MIGFAETATGLAHQVAEALDCAWLQNTSRHADCAGQISFDESHSHARNQWLRALPDDLPDGPLVIVDDELSTGATAAKLIALLHRRSPRSRYVLACLVDARRGPGPLEALSAELDVPIDVVSLGRLGDVSLPSSGWSAGALPERAVAAVEPVVEEFHTSGRARPSATGWTAPGGRRSGSSRRRWAPSCRRGRSCWAAASTWRCRSSPRWRPGRRRSCPRRRARRRRCSTWRLSAARRARVPTPGGPVDRRVRLQRG